MQVEWYPTILVLAEFAIAVISISSAGVIYNYFRAGFQMYSSPTVSN